MSINPGESVPVDFEDVFDDWIAGATVAKRSVQIYGKPHLVAEFEQLERDLRIAEEVEKSGAEMAGAESTRIRRRMQEIHDEWMASKSVWTVRGVTSEEADDLKAAEPALVEPEPLVAPERPVLPPKATEQQQKSHTIAMQEYEKAKADYDAALPEHQAKRDAYNDALNLRYLTAAVLKIERPGGKVAEAEVDEDGRVVKPVVTVEQLQKMRKRLGEAQLLHLITASQAALIMEPEIPAPFWQDSSESEETSS